MSWTEKPTDSGYYWARRKETGKIEPVYFDVEMAACPDCPICVSTLGWDVEELADNFDRWLKLEEPAPPPAPEPEIVNTMRRIIQATNEGPCVDPTILIPPPTSPTGEQD